MSSLLIYLNPKSSTTNHNWMGRDSCLNNPGVNPVGTYPFLGMDFEFVIFNLADMWESVYALANSDKYLVIVHDGSQVIFLDDVVRFHLDWHLHIIWVGKASVEIEICQVDTNLVAFGVDMTLYMRILAVRISVLGV